MTTPNPDLFARSRGKTTRQMLNQMVAPRIMPPLLPEPPRLQRTPRGGNELTRVMREDEHSPLGRFADLEPSSFVRYTEQRW